MVTVREWQQANALRHLNGEPELPYPDPASDDDMPVSEPKPEPAPPKRAAKPAAAKAKG